jgi:HD-GYP domain-containing protein (c-di-GMP phosphodiesterase class II)
MRLCATKDLRPGMRIARDVCDDRLELLVAAGFLVSERVIDRLVELEVDDLYIEEPGTEDINPEPEVVSDKTRRRTHKLLKRTFDDLANLSDMQEITNEDVITILQYDDRYANAVKVSDFHEVVHRTVEDLFTQHVDMFQTPVVKTYLNRSYEHALNTAVLSIMLGRAFGYAQEELLVLGTAAMLHDVGKLVLPGLAERPLRDLSLEEMRLLRLHPAAGSMILSRSSTNTSLEQATIRQHHEQQDGRGYPLKLTGTNDPPIKVRVQRNEQIFRFAEILSVANAFDNLINGDLIVEAMSPVKAMETLVRGAGSLYNRAVVSKALELINVYPVGSIVEITVGNLLFDTGMRGVVRRSTGQRLHKPEILVLWDKRGNKLETPRLLDLNLHRGVEIDLM